MTAGGSTSVAFDGTVYQDNIWPSESENAFYYISDSGSATTLCTFSLDTMMSSEMATLASFNTGYFLHDKYYYAKNGTYNSGTSSYQYEVRCYDILQGSDTLLF